MLLNPEITRNIAENLGKELREDNYRRAAALSKRLSTARTASVLLQVDEKKAGELLKVLDKKRAGRVLANLPPEYAVRVLAVLPEDERIRMVNTVPPDNLAEILDALEEEERVTLVGALDRRLREHLARINRYPRGSAGRLMSPFFLAVKGSQPVGETLQTILAAPPEIERAPYIYVVDENDRAIGVVSVKDLLRVGPSSEVREVMNPDLVTVRYSDAGNEAARIIRNRRLMMLPVVDPDGGILGVITFDDAMRVLSEEAASLIVSSSAAPVEESFFTPPAKAIKGRLPWMAINVFLNMGAVIVITGFEETIARVAILAAFIPMITDMGGNVGIQSLSVAIRSIALGEVRLRDFRKVLKKEMLVGVFNGLALGLLFSIIAFLLRGNPYLGLVAGVALGTNVLVAGIAGGALPFVIKSLGKDPAMMTGPFLTTITDITGVSIYLGLSTVFMSLLV